LFVGSNYELRGSWVYIAWKYEVDSEVIDIMQAILDGVGWNTGLRGEYTCANETASHTQHKQLALETRTL
jgi:hypothetical protein